MLERSAPCADTAAEVKLIYAVCRNADGRRLWMDLHRDRIMGSPRQCAPQHLTRDGTFDRFVLARQMDATRRTRMESGARTSPDVNVSVAATASANLRSNESS